MARITETGYRAGDQDSVERVNEGEVELNHFYPDDANSGRDMVTALNQSPMRKWIYGDENIRRAHQSTDRTPWTVMNGLLKHHDMPKYVINFPIEIGDRKWEYETEVFPPENLRRVFIFADQAIQVYMKETLDALSASEGSGRIFKTKPQIIAEAGNVNNQAMMQIMTDRVLRGESMLPGSFYSLFIPYEVEGRE
jgi:hypothetical protein